MTLPSFFADAECKGLETRWFFPWGGGPEMRPSPLAEQACSRCKVREDCLTWSIAPPFQAGYWGGMTEPERLEERRRRHMEKQNGQRKAARRAAAQQRQVAA